MFNVIEDFYSQSDLGLVIAHFVNLPFDQTHRSRDWAVVWTDLVEYEMMTVECYLSDLEVA